MLPWLYYMSAPADAARPSSFVWTRLVELKFWSHWFTEPFGVHLSYSVGNTFQEFLAWPIVGGQATYGVGILHVLIYLLAAGIVGAALVQCIRNRTAFVAGLTGRGSATSMLFGVALLGYGFILMASRIAFQRHYLLIVFPLPLVWLASLALPSDASPSARALWRKLLLALVVVEALLTWQFLNYLDVSGGAPLDGFGVSLKEQIRLGRVLEVPVDLPHP